jgi:hypothetical protein
LKYSFFIAPQYKRRYTLSLYIWTKKLKIFFIFDKTIKKW